MGGNWSEIILGLGSVKGRGCVGAGLGQGLEIG